ncbi:SGNH/GDSL hydrolase family protein [Candidatus Marinimicrobia bacterium]|nr:SGNH/GDSL hydrolase family protein [Candidatus Neomarinimicrobiota bacterium]
MDQNSSIFNFRALKIPFTVLALYLVLEIVFRIYFFGVHTVFNWKKFNPQGILVTDIAHKVSDPYISWKLTPNINKYFKTKMFTTNSLGLRNPEIQLNKQIGITRIAVLGRSVTMGAGVNDDEVYTRVLQKKLDEWKPDAYEIINCAVGGYNIKQMAEYYESYVSLLKPDLVFLPITKSDLTKFIPDKPLPFEAAIPEHTNLRYYLSFSFIYESARLLAKRITNKTISTDWNDRLRETMDLAEPTIKASVILSRFLNKLNKDEIPCYVYSARRSNQFNKEYLELSRNQMKNWVQQHEGAVFLNSDDYIIKFFSNDYTVYFGDNHPSAEMHRVMANALFENMKYRYSQ